MDATTYKQLRSPCPDEGSANRATEFPNMIRHDRADSIHIYDGLRFDDRVLG